MITIFNRKELCITFSMEEYVRVRQVLQRENIPYITDVFNHTSNSNLGKFGENMDYANEYVIYVHKKDFERANYLVG